MKRVEPSILKCEQGLSPLFVEVVDQSRRMMDFASLEEESLCKLAREISLWHMGNHLEHLMITGRSAIVMLEKSLIEEERDVGPNADGLKLLEWLYLPRGETQSPEFAIPKGLSVKKLRSSLRRFSMQLNDVGEKLDVVETAKGRVGHPYLGFLDAREWLVFLCIHQNHHLCIIEEIHEAVVGSRT